MERIEAVYTAILKGKFKEVPQLVHDSMAQKANARAIIDGSLIPAMEEIGRRFENGQAFVPEMLMAARSMKIALDLLTPFLLDGQSLSLGVVAIGTVKGDLHDIGKNLVASMLEGVGFKVINLGVDVSAETFIAAIREQGATIICMSALLTTTMGHMKLIISEIEQAGLRNDVKIMVGGAPVSKAFAAEIGADGYSDNANAATELAKMLAKGVLDKL